MIPITNHGQVMELYGRKLHDDLRKGTASYASRSLMSRPFDAVLFFRRTVQGTPQIGDGQAAIRHRCNNRPSQDNASCGMHPGIVDNFMGYFLARMV